MQIAWPDFLHEQPGAQRLSSRHVFPGGVDKPARRLGRSQRGIGPQAGAACPVALRTKQTLGFTVHPSDVCTRPTRSKIVHGQDGVRSGERQRLQCVSGARPACREMPSVKLGTEMLLR